RNRPCGDWGDPGFIRDFNPLDMSDLGRALGRDPGENGGRTEPTLFRAGSPTVRPSVSRTLSPTCPRDPTVAWDTTNERTAIFGRAPAVGMAERTGESVSEGRCKHCGGKHDAWVPICPVTHRSMHGPTPRAAASGRQAVIPPAPKAPVAPRAPARGG